MWRAMGVLLHRGEVSIKARELRQRVAGDVRCSESCGIAGDARRSAVAHSHILERRSQLITMTNEPVWVSCTPS